MVHNWELSKKMGRIVIQCDNEENAKDAAANFGGTVEQIDGIWVNVWPREIAKSDSCDQPYTDSSKIFQ